MKKFMFITFFAMLLSACVGGTPQTNKKLSDIAPYPNPDANYSRHVIYLPSLKNENDVRIELLVGKEMVVDCNLHILAGGIQKKELVGWGYSYYYVNTHSENATISTRKGCLNQEKRNEFVSINTNLGWIRYNSSLPIVVYAPHDLQVNYRLWFVDDKMLSGHIE